MYISCFDQSQPQTNGITTVFENNMGANGNSHSQEGEKMKMKITRVRHRVSKKSNRWLEVGNVVRSEEHKCIIESTAQGLDDIIINASQYILHSQYMTTSNNNGIPLNI